MIQSRIILSLLPVIVLLIFPFVSSQNTRGAAANFDADATAEELDNERRRLGWLYDLLKKLAEEAETDAPTIMNTTAAPSTSPVQEVVPAGETSSPTYYPSYLPTSSPVTISPLKKKKKKNRKNNKVGTFMAW